MLSPFVSAEADLEGEYSRLDGLTTTIMVISCTFLGVSLIAISLRTYVRLSRNLFRLDDGFMIAGAVSYFLDRRWNRSISLASICSFQVLGILHCGYLFDNKSPPGGYCVFIPCFDYNRCSTFDLEFLHIHTQHMLVDESIVTMVGDHLKRIQVQASKMILVEDSSKITSHR